MRKHASLVVGVVLIGGVLLIASPAPAQIPQQAPARDAVPPPLPPQTFQYPGEPAPRAADPGVAFVTVMDRPEVRILRVELQPGGARRTHTHDDVTFHLVMPVNGPLQLTMGPETVDAKPGQAYFMAAGTPHSFRNPGSKPVTIMEVFVKAAPKQAGDAEPVDPLALALAAVASPSAAPR